MLHGLEFQKTAWRLPLDVEFHAETGYWLWDADRKQVMQAFLVPRGISVLAGGSATADATKLELSAERGSSVFGICSNPFLDEVFRTVRYELEVELLEGDMMSYRAITFIEVKGQQDVFRHTDENTLKRVHVPE